MTEAQVRALDDTQLALVGVWVQDEQKIRTDKHERKTIARIKELAGEAGILVSIAGTRGRPKAAAKPAAVQINEPSSGKK